MSEPCDNPFESPAVPEIVGPAAESTAAAPRPRVWTVFTVFVIAEIVNLFAVVIVQLSLIALTQGPEGFSPRRIEKSIEQVMLSTPGFLGMLVTSQLVFIAAALVPAMLSPVPLARRLALARSGAGPLRLLIAFAGTLAIGLALDGLGGLGLVPDSTALTMLSNFIAALSLPEFVLALLVIGLLPGIGEELFFRGYIQTRLSRRWGPRVGVVVAAGLFGLMHLDLVQGTFAFLLGIYLGWLTERSGSIRPAMFCHAANNAVACVFAYAGWENPGLATSLIFLAISPFLLAASIALLARPRKGDGQELAAAPP